MKKKKFSNLHFYSNADYNKDDLLRLCLNFTPVDTQMLYYYMFATYYSDFVKSPALSVVSGPCNVLRQERTFDIL